VYDRVAPHFFDLLFTKIGFHVNYDGLASWKEMVMSQDFAGEWRCLHEDLDAMVTEVKLIV
jgi:hypothetical protein